MALCNRGRQGLRVRLRGPAQAKPFLSFIPEEVVLLPGPSRLAVNVKFSPSASFLEQCGRFCNAMTVSEQSAGDLTSEGAVDIPCKVGQGGPTWGRGKEGQVIIGGRTGKEG